MNDEDLKELRKYMEEKVNEAIANFPKFIEKYEKEYKEKEKKERLEEIENLKKNGYTYRCEYDGLLVFGKKGEENIYLAPLD